MSRVAHRIGRCLLKTVTIFSAIGASVTFAYISIMAIASACNDRRRNRIKDKMVDQFILEQHRLGNYIDIVKSEVVCRLTHPDDELIDIFNYTVYISYRNIKSGQYQTEERFIEQNWI